MKIRYPVIAIIIILIIYTISGTFLTESQIGNGIMGILNLLLLICCGLIIYLIIRNIFRAITHKKSEEPLKAKIDLLAQQLGIQYGTSEEKLEQIALIAAKAQKLEASAKEP